MIDVPDVEKERDGEARPGRHRLAIEMGDIEQGEAGHILLAKINGEYPIRLHSRTQINHGSICMQRTGAVAR